MKKLLFIIICLIALAQSEFQPILFASAEPNAKETVPTAIYARANVADGYFFTQKDLSSSIFAIPYTYCVQIIRDDGEWYYVKYAEDDGAYRALYGYVLKEDFTPLYAKPTVTYLNKIITVTYRTDDGSSSLPVLGEITVDAAFYGVFYTGATAYSYVLCQNSFGYIQGATEDYPLNEFEEPKSENMPNGEGERSVNSGMVTAIVLIVLAAGALVVLFVTSRKRDKLG